MNPGPGKGALYRRCLCTATRGGSPSALWVRLWRKSSQTRSMEERDELHRMLREIEERIAQVEGFLQGIGVDPWD